MSETPRWAAEGEILRAARVSAGMGQEACARALGVSKQAWSGWERGAARPRAEAYAVVGVSVPPTHRSRRRPEPKPAGPRPHGPRPHPARDEIRRLHVEGRTDAEIVAALGVTLDLIDSVLHGLRVRRAPPRGNGRWDRDAVYAAIRQRHRETQETDREIAAALDVGATTVGAALRGHRVRPLARRARAAELHARIRALHDAEPALTTREIAEALDCSPATAAAALRGHRSADERLHVALPPGSLARAHAVGLRGQAITRLVLSEIERREQASGIPARQH